MKSFNGKKMSHGTRRGATVVTSRPVCAICGKALELFNGRPRCMTLGAGGSKIIQHGVMTKQKIRYGSTYYTRKQA